MASDVLGLNFKDGTGYTWTLTPGGTLTNVLDVALAISGIGAQWYHGTAVPTTLHNDGDLYIRDTNGEVYKQVAGAWVDQGFSLQGATGATGATGSTGATGGTGATGAAGSQIYFGTAAPSTLHTDGDIYIRSTGAMYKQVASAWVDQNIPTRQILAAWSGTMPIAIGAGVVWKVPKISGASATFLLSFAVARVETTPSGSSAQFVLEKSSGGGAFALVATVSTLTIGPAAYEASDSAVAVSVTTGDLLRLRFAALGGLAGACGYSIELQGAQTA